MSTIENIKKLTSSEFVREVKFDKNGKITDKGQFEIDEQNSHVVWFLTGSNEQQLETCLQVASSKNIFKEIERDWSLMNLGKEYSRSYVRKNYQSNIIEVKSLFNKEQYSYVKPKDVDKLGYLYRQIADDYEELKFYIITDVDNYLSSDASIKGLEDVPIPVYAEVKIALDTKARYWNYWPSGPDGKVFKQLTKKEDEVNKL